MWARIENNRVMEIIEFDPKGRFHPDFESQFVECDETIKQNYSYKDGVFAEPITIIDPKQEILNELTELDKIIDRQTEQVYADLGIIPSYPPMVNAINRKKELRAALNNLS